MERVTPSMKNQPCSDRQRRASLRSQRARHRLGLGSKARRRSGHCGGGAPPSQAATHSQCKARGAGSRRGRNQGQEGFVFKQGVQSPHLVECKTGEKTVQRNNARARERKTQSPLLTMFSKQNPQGKGRETGPDCVFQPQAEHSPGNESRSPRPVLLQIKALSRSRSELIMNTAAHTVP